MNFNCTRLYKLQNKKILMDILKINTFIEPDTKKEVSFFSLSKNITMQQNLKKRIIKIKKVKKNGKARICWDYNPVPPLKILLNSLKLELNKVFISNDDYLSYVFNRKSSNEIAYTNIYNAYLHKEYNYTMTMDIENFFPSIHSKYIFQFFHEKLLMSSDISAFLTNMTTIKYDNFIGLPQGASTSNHLSFLACYDTFENINNYCKKRNIIFSIFVDDMTFSGQNINLKEIYNFVQKEINKIGLNVAIHKTKYYNMKKISHKKINNILINKNKILVYPKEKQIRNLEDSFNLKSKLGLTQYHKQVKKFNI